VGVDWWYAANAWSALGAGVAVALVHRLAVQLVPARFGLDPRSAAAVALVPAGLLALHPLWLEAATLAEVHSWHIAWLAGAALAALRIARDAGAGAGHPRRAALAWGAWCGVGLAHHGTAVFFVLALSVVVVRALARSGGASAGVAGAWLVGALVPLLAYGFVAWRAYHPAAYQWPLLEPSLRSVVEHVRGATYGRLVGGFAPSDAQRALLASAVYPWLVAGGVALVVVFRAGAGAPRAVLAGLAGGALLQAGFVARYGVSDPGPYFLPLLLVALLGLQLVPAWIVARAGQPVVPFALALFLLGVLAPGWVRTARERDARLVDVERRVHAAFRAIPYPDAVVLWQNDLYVRLRGYQLLAGEAPGLEVENPGLFTWAAPRRAFALRNGVDPLAGLVLRSDADLARIAPHLAAVLPRPVVRFEDVLAATP